MDKVTIHRVKRALLGVKFEEAAPARDSEYWLFGSPATSAEGLRMLPSLLGLAWSWQGDELVVDFIDGPESGGSDLLSWQELVGVAADGYRLLLRWAGCRLPVRVIVCPGIGVRVAIEHMDEEELINLHHRVVEEFVKAAIEDMQTHTLLVGCDTRGIVQQCPERLLGYAGGLAAPLLCPDYLLTHRALAQSGVETAAHQKTQAYDGLCLISTPR